MGDSSVSEWRLIADIRNELLEIRNICRRENICCQELTAKITNTINGIDDSASRTPPYSLPPPFFVASDDGAVNPANIKISPGNVAPFAADMSDEERARYFRRSLAYNAPKIKLGDLIG